MKTSMISRPTRRQFVKTASAAMSLPWLVPSTIFGANPPSDRIHVGIIGAGNQSLEDVPAFLRQPDVQILAVCDVNTASHGYKTPEQFLGREPLRKQVDAFYAEKNGAGQYHGCDAYGDFRKVLQRDDIDAVLIVTPDHWHAPMVVMAAAAGKDIYCEKPISLTVRHGRAMVNAVRKHKRILQTGSQYRSSPINRHACELVRNGRIGKLKRIITSVVPNNKVGPGPGWKPMPVPEGFDYDMWLGPAPVAPYHKDRCFYRFRFILDYSGGQTTNFGCHSNDIAQWGGGYDDTVPVEYEDLGGEWPVPGSLFTTPTKIDFRATYADGVELICKTTPSYQGCRFEGTEGWVHFHVNTLQTHPESLKDSVIGPDEFHLPVSNPDRKENTLSKYLLDHVRNFLEAVKSRRDPIEPVEIGHRTASISHLGNIVMKLRRKIRFDPEKERILDDEEADAMLDRPLRAPWHV
jgi:predicted dehydrogenase